MRDLLNEILRRIHANERVILCAVVETRGSCPQKAGAAMAVFEDANTLGTLGGGCVEAEVRRRALEAREETVGRVMSFHLDHDYGWDDGLVCGGIMEIIALPIARDLNLKMIEQAVDNLKSNRAAVLNLDGIDEASRQRSFKIELPVRPKLIIAGAGHVGRAVSQLAHDVGFEVTVIDDRADMLNSHRFPNANCVTGEIPATLKSSPIDDNTFVVIVTRGHRNDGEALHAVVNSPAKYVGLIGSQRKIREIARRLQLDGVSRDALARVHAPIGLAIGAVTPNEIAISIMAELIAIHRNAGDAGRSMKVPTERLDKWLARM